MNNEDKRGSDFFKEYCIDYNIRKNYSPQVLMPINPPPNNLLQSCLNTQEKIYNTWYGCIIQDNDDLIKKVIFHDPATIVYWQDGTKTVVKCGENEKFDPEKGLAMAISKKCLGTNDSYSNYYNIFKKWLPKEDE